MRIELTLSFQKELEYPGLCYYFFNKYVKFEPYSFTKKYSTSAWNSKKHLRILEQEVGMNRIFIDDKNGNTFSFSQTGGISHSFFSISVKQNSNLISSYDYLIDELIIMPGFVSAYLFDADYEYIQSQKFESNYIGMNYSQELLDTLKNTPHEPAMHGHKQYDIRFNPGRLQLISYTWLMAAWKMWFGSPFYKLVPKEKLLCFPNAVDIKELYNDVTYIQLFEELEKSHSKENMLIQWKWRDWIDFDSLEKKYP